MGDPDLLGQSDHMAGGHVGHCANRATCVA
jgi:hypothetical protein